MSDPIKDYARAIVEATLDSVAIHTDAGRFRPSPPTIDAILARVPAPPGIGVCCMCDAKIPVACKDCVDYTREVVGLPAPEAQHHEHTPSSEAPHHPARARSFDARDWARDFNATAKSLGYCEMDEGWLITWFANAIMRGFDEHAQRSEAQHHDAPTRDGWWWARWPAGDWTAVRVVARDVNRDGADVEVWHVLVIGEEDEFQPHEFNRWVGPLIEPGKGEQ